MIIRDTPEVLNKVIFKVRPQRIISISIKKLEKRQNDCYNKYRQVELQIGRTEETQI